LLRTQQHLKKELFFRLPLAPAGVPHCFKGKLSAKQTDEVKKRLKKGHLIQHFVPPSPQGEGRKNNGDGTHLAGDLLRFNWTGTRRKGRYGSRV
jgi:hypothetical protein